MLNQAKKLLPQTILIHSVDPDEEDDESDESCEEYTDVPSFLSPVFVVTFCHNYMPWWALSSV